MLTTTIASTVTTTTHTHTTCSTYEWKEQNDPVMGGQSTGNWSVVGDHGVFQGVTKIVPFLKGGRSLLSLSSMVS